MTVSGPGLPAEGHVRDGCPRCRAPLRMSYRWFGLVGRTPSACDRCGSQLAYDLAGGIYALAERVDDTAR